MVDVTHANDNADRRAEAMCWMKEAGRPNTFDYITNPEWFPDWTWEKIEAISGR